MIHLKKPRTKPVENYSKDPLFNYERINAILEAKKKATANSNAYMKDKSKSEKDAASPKN